MWLVITYVHDEVSGGVACLIDTKKREPIGPRLGTCQLKSGSNRRRGFGVWFRIVFEA